MIKQAIREQFLAARKALSLAEVEKRSQQITDQFLRWLAAANDASLPKTIHVFLPIQRQQEVNTWLIIHAVWQYYPAIQLAASVTDFRSHSMTHYPLTNTTILLNNKWGIPEPTSDTQTTLDAKQLDVVLVPLLGFDKQGQRVGYGGGFYDRFLAECRTDCVKVGLSLFDPITQITSIEPTDIMLDKCITPTQIWQFSI